MFTFHDRNSAQIPVFEAFCSYFWILAWIYEGIPIGNPPNHEFWLRFTKESLQAARENSCQTLGNSGARLGKYQISGRYFYFRSLFLSGPYFYCRGPSRRAHVVKSCISSISGGRFPVVIFILSHPRESQPPGFLGFPVPILISRSLFLSGPYSFPVFIFASGL